MDITSNIIFIVLTGLGALLVAIPLPKALASGNAGTSMLIVWTKLTCLVSFVNAIRWNRNVENWAPAWCDFCNYFLLAADVAIAASSVSINRHLYMIASLNPWRHEKLFNTAIDIVLCLVIPLASVALQYIVQQYRFYIYEDIGCISGVGTVNLSFPLVWMLPLFAGTVSAAYACLTIRASRRRKHALMGEAWSRRLVALGIISTMYGLIPTSISVALSATAFPVTPWPGWRSIHSTNNIIVRVPAREWQSDPIWSANVQLRRWTITTLAFVVFVFLGLTADMKRVYGAPFRSVIGSVSQPRTATDQEENADEHSNSQKAPRWLRFLRIHLRPSWKPRVERQHESVDLTNRSRLDSDLEGLRLVLPTSQSRVDPDEPSRKLDYKEHDYPVELWLGH